MIQLFLVYLVFCFLTTKLKEWEKIPISLITRGIVTYYFVRWTNEHVWTKRIRIPYDRWFVYFSISQLLCEINQKDLLYCRHDYLCNQNLIQCTCKNRVHASPIVNKLYIERVCFDLILSIFIKKIVLTVRL